MTTKILAIDDERDFTEMIRSYFEPRGYEVLVADRGDIGVEISKREKPEVALVDFKMPGINGDEVLKIIKKNDPLAKVIMITAFHDDGKTKNMLMSIGAYACLDKPIESLKALEETIKAAINT